MGLLEVKNVYFKYKKDILRDVTFYIEKGSFTALLGVNGAGMQGIRIPAAVQFLEKNKYVREYEF